MTSRSPVRCRSGQRREHGPLLIENRGAVPVVAHPFEGCDTRPPSDLAAAPDSDTSAAGRGPRRSSLTCGRSRIATSPTAAVDRRPRLAREVGLLRSFEDRDHQSCHPSSLSFVDRDLAHPRVRGRLRNATPKRLTCGASRSNADLNVPFRPRSIETAARPASRRNRSAIAARRRSRPFEDRDPTLGAAMRSFQDLNAIDRGSRLRATDAARPFEGATSWARPPLGKTAARPLEGRDYSFIQEARAS